MRESAKSGVLDGFILEYQTYENTPELKKDYVFTPFGVRHDSPMYAIGNLTQEKKEILNKFVEFCKAANHRSLQQNTVSTGLTIICLKYRILTERL